MKRTLWVALFSACVCVLASSAFADRGIALASGGGGGTPTPSPTPPAYKAPDGAKTSGWVTIANVNDAATIYGLPANASSCTAEVEGALSSFSVIVEVSQDNVHWYTSQNAIPSSATLTANGQAQLNPSQFKGVRARLTATGGGSGWALVTCGPAVVAHIGVSGGGGGSFSPGPFPVPTPYPTPNTGSIIYQGGVFGASGDASKTQLGLGYDAGASEPSLFADTAGDLILGAWFYNSIIANSGRINVTDGSSGDSLSLVEGAATVADAAGDTLQMINGTNTMSSGDGGVVQEKTDGSVLIQTAGTTVPLTLNFGGTSCAITATTNTCGGGGGGITLQPTGAPSPNPTPIANAMYLQGPVVIDGADANNIANTDPGGATGLMCGSGSTSCNISSGTSSGQAFVFYNSNPFCSGAFAYMYLWSVSTGYMDRFDCNGNLHIAGGLITGNVYGSNFMYPFHPGSAATCSITSPAKSCTASVTLPQSGMDCSASPDGASVANGVIAGVDISGTTETLTAAEQTSVTDTVTFHNTCN